MADSTTNITQIEVAQAQKEVTVNGLFDAFSPSSFGGRRAEASVSLTWGYYGGRWGGTNVPNGTLTLAPSTTNYVIADRATGAIILDSNSPGGWNDPDNYARLYKITTGVSFVSNYEDHRAGPAGLFVSSFLIATADIKAWLADPTSAKLAAALTDEAGSGVVVFANGSVLTLGGNNMTFPGAAAKIGYLNIPQNSQSGNYTTVASDAGKHIFHPAADVTARTWTIDSNANVPYDIGTAITFDNEHGAGAITIAITSDTLELVGSAGSTGSRTLASGGQATALKITSTKWRIGGTGLT